MILGLLRKIAAHHHSWRRMTGEQDYGKYGPHFGGYHGVEEEICRLCGITREVRGWQAWKYELDDAEKRVQYLRDTEPQRQFAAQSDEGGKNG